MLVMPPFIIHVQKQLPRVTFSSFFKNQNVILIIKKVTELKECPGPDARIAIFSAIQYVEHKIL